MAWRAELIRLRRRRPDERPAAWRREEGIDRIVVAWPDRRDLATERERVRDEGDPEDKPDDERDARGAHVYILALHADAQAIPR